jgi:diaminopimelate decarboxylase/aspartate kinase
MLFMHSLPESTRAMNTTVVLKFGGTSVSTRQRWDTIHQIATSMLADGERPVIVCSAVSGVSNLLDALLPAAVRGEHEPLLAEIRGKHEALGESLGVDWEAILADDLTTLERVALGASLLGEVSPRLRAQVMARGELMSTRLGAAFLNARGLPTRWRDAREMLTAVGSVEANPARHYLSSSCRFDPDPALHAELLGQDEPVTLTQGFIARDPDGETVLLGRGGSDTSASYLAAKLGATRLEIWTDVPGMFTANPREIPSARLLRLLGYDEAQELATMGAKVLHPRCVDPVRQRGIPLHIRCTPHPDMEGTVVRGDVPDFGAQVKAISAKGSIPLVSMSTVGMWQQVGFLADVFGMFKRNGLSIDLVATSETNVTASLDPVANALDEQALGRLVRDLGEVCKAQVIGPCAAVSLVGRGIRAILHKLGPALEAFEERRVYLMSQASSDLNLTFVVDEEHAGKLVRQLHALVFGDRAPDELIGPTWRELFSDAGAGAGEGATQRWWAARRDELLALPTPGQPVYVYDEDTLGRAADDIASIEALDRRFYAIKANPNPDILRLFHGRGFGFECVSVGELEHVLGLFPDLDRERLLFTPNFAPIGEYARGFELGAWVTLDNMHPLARHPEVFRDQRVLVRVDPGAGKGHHKKVRTAGASSKFGVPTAELPELAERAGAVGATIVGLHAHVGSGIRSAQTWAEVAAELARAADAIGGVEILDVGGGLGVPERPGEPALSIPAVAEALAAFKAANPQYALWMEPGRYLVAQAGALLTTVTQLKGKGARVYVGVDTGMHHLLRPSLYGAFHAIVNLTRHGEPVAITADVVGPICETGDVLGYGRRLPETREGDVLLIGTAGAYGAAMSSDYNLRARAREVMLPTSTP